MLLAHIPLSSGILLWAALFSPLQRAITILLGEAGKCGLVSINQSVLRCGT